MEKVIRWRFIVCFCLFQMSASLFSQGFTSSNLPIVVISTGGATIAPYHDVIATMGIIDNGTGVRNNMTDPFNNYNGKVEIRYQGSSTLNLPKKSYRITTIDNFNNKIDAPLLGLPAEEDWILKALYQDKSLLRDELAFRIFRQMGRYSSRTRFFELVVDGSYEGIYQLEEKVKRDDNRVNIAKMVQTDTGGDNLTGGYIIALDNFMPGEPGWYSKYPSNVTQDSANYFLYHYPKPDSIVPEQKTYIKNYFDAFEDALVGPAWQDPWNGYRKYIEIQSFADVFIMNELTRNVDGYRRSTFFHKDKDSKGGKLKAGPIWDFNIAWGNASYNNGNNPSGWAFQETTNMNFTPFWWWKFMTDTVFMNELRCRYQNFRTNVLNVGTINSFIDSMAVYLDEAQQRNFARWPIMGTVIYPNPSPPPSDYAGEIGSLKYWVQARMNWLDSQLYGNCVVGIDEHNGSQNLISVYPNPFSDLIQVNYDLSEAAELKIEFYTMLGNKALVLNSGLQSPGHWKEQINTSELPEGSYILSLQAGSSIFHQKIIKIVE
jgi:hypothetical protein